MRRAGRPTGAEGWWKSSAWFLAQWFMLHTGTTRTFRVRALLQPSTQLTCRNHDVGNIRSVLRLCAARVATLRAPNQSVHDVELGRASQAVWLPTLHTLRALPQSAERDTVVEMWYDYGRRLGFDEHAPNEQRQGEEAAALHEEGRGAGCRWRDCLCYDEPHVAHPMHVCKGCWQAQYCGTICQTR